MVTHERCKIKILELRTDCRHTDFLNFFITYYFLFLILSHTQQSNYNFILTECHNTKGRENFGIQKLESIVRTRAINGKKSKVEERCKIRQLRGTYFNFE